MRISVITATFNRAHGIERLLDSIAVTLAALPPGEGEIVLVDNNSTDATAETVKRWMAANPDIPMQFLFEPVAGTSRARNRGIAAARGTLLAFTDDDCRLAPDFATKALAYDALDTAEPIIRGGRIELGDAQDLPLTIKLQPEPQTWTRAARSARHQNLADSLIGCNMTLRKTTALALNGFDIRFGPGTSLPAAEDSDLYYRAYLAGMTLAYVPDLIVKHDHGRKTPAEGRGILRNYCIANGGLFAKYALRHPDFCRPFVWDLKHVAREVLRRQNDFMPEYDFSHCNKMCCFLRGMRNYVLATLRMRLRPAKAVD